MKELKSNLIPEYRNVHPADDPAGQPHKRDCLSLRFIDIFQNNKLQNQDFSLN